MFYRVKTLKTKIGCGIIVALTIHIASDDRRKE